MALLQFCVVRCVSVFIGRFWFGTRGSEVQILSPRFIDSNRYSPFRNASGTGCRRFVDVISSTIISFQCLSTIRVSTRRRSSIFGGLPSAKESQGKTAIAIATSALARNYHSLLTNSDRLADGCQGDLARATHCAKFPAHRGLNRNLFISLLTRLRRG